jgi:FHS family Na+ dependent glucose MFS transporter 1
MNKTLLYALAFTALGLITGSLGPTLPMLAAQTQASTGEISWLFIARATGTMIGALALAKLYDRRAGHPLLAGALWLGATVFAFAPHLRWLWALALLFVLSGIASSTINVGGNTLIALVHGARVGPFLGLIHFAFGLGGLLAPLLAKAFAARPDALWWTYSLFAALIAPVGLLLFFSPSPPLPPSTLGSATLTRVDRTIMLLLLFFFLEVGAEAALSGWLFTYATARGVSENTAFYLNSAFWAAFTLGRLGSIPLALRFSERYIVIAHLVGWLLLLLLSTYLPNLTAALWLVAIGSGLAMAPIFPMMLAFAQRTLHLSGRITGWLLVASALGGMSLPWLIGQLFEAHGAQVMIWLVNFDLIVVLIVFFMLLAHVRTIKRQAEKPAGSAELKVGIYDP